jgi:general stress protein 26
VSVSGTAALIRDRAKIEEFWNPIYKAWFPDGLDDPTLALLVVNVEKAEYWDVGSSKMIQLVGFVKALATGEQFRPGDNAKLELADA